MHPSSDREFALVRDHRQRITDLEAQVERLEAENAVHRSLRDAVLAGDKAIEDAYAAWDSDRDMRVGKILGAMMGSTPGYREDTDTFSEAVRRAKLAERQGGA